MKHLFTTKFLSLLLSCLCWFTPYHALAQNLLWKANLTGTGNNAPSKSIIDSNNNLYVIGTFTGTCVGANPTLTAKGATDIFIIKYNSNGDFQWARQIGGTSTESATGIVVTEDNSFIYVTGYFKDTLHVDGASSIISTGEEDCFLAKFTDQGKILWIKNIAKGTASQKTNDIKIDKNNQLVLGGVFNSNIILGDEQKNVSLATNVAIGLFFSRFDLDGNMIDAKKFEATNSLSSLYTFECDDNGYYLTGYFSGTIITNDLPQKVSNAADVFVCKLNYDLKGQWLIKVGGPGNDYLYSCSADHLGNFYIGGHFYGASLVADSTVNGNPSVKTMANTNNNGTADIFFAKYNTDGTLQWINTAGSKGNDYLYRAAYKNGNFIAAGQYGDTMNFNKKTIYPRGNGDAFVIVYKSSNIFNCVASASGVGIDIGSAAVGDNDGNFILIGAYKSSKLYFSDRDSLVNTHTGYYNIFVAKYAPAVHHITVQKSVTHPACAGAATGAIDITPEGEFSAPLTYSWCRADHPSVSTHTQDLTGLRAGTYIVTITDAWGYTKVDTAVVSDPPAISLSATVAPVTCENAANDGKITLNDPVHGTAPYTYKWNNGLYTQEISDLAVGTYTVTVTDSAGCTATLSRSISYGAPILSHITVTNIDPPASTTGSIDLGITGGYAPLSYQWSNGASTASISGLRPGRYYVTVTDEKQCTKTYDARVSDLTYRPYLLSGQVPDPDTRTLDASLQVGTMAGNASVSPSGAASYSIPVLVPPGIGGMKPEIALAYSSQAGNGIAGWGWNVTGLSAITRTLPTISSDGKAKGLQLTAADPYAWDGNRLLLISGSQGGDGSVYATENETFAKITAHGDHGNTGPEWFEVTARNGMKYKYGLSQTSKLLYDCNAGTYHKQAVIAWYLDEVEDPFGNYMSYTYEQEGLTTYIKKITYGTNKNNDTQKYNSIEFYYTQRMDPVPVHYGELLATADQLLYKITTKNAGTIYRNYELRYTSDVYSRLVKITESTGDGKTLNPTIVKWGKYAANTDTCKVSVVHSVYKDFADQNYAAADINGDGFADMVSVFPYDYPCGPGCTSHTNMAQVYYNTRAADGSRTFAPGGPIDLGANINLDFKSYITGNSSGDIDGDGKSEIIIPRFNDVGGAQIVFNVIKDGGNSQIGQNLQASSGTPVYAIGDVNNDGVDEIVFLERGTNDYLNYPGKIAFFKQQKWVSIVHQSPSDRIDDFYIHLVPEKMFIADFDGDGMQDIMVLDLKGFRIHRNRGGNEDSLFSASAPLNTSFSSNYHISMGDFNGDGLPDFIMNKVNTDEGEWTMALNNGKMGFDLFLLYGITVRDDKDTDKDDDKDNTDFNNDGKSDIIICDAAYDNWEHSWGSSWKTFTGFSMYWYQFAGNNFELVKTVVSGDEPNAYNKYFITGDFNGDGRTDLMNYGFDGYYGTDAARKWRLYSISDTTHQSGAMTAIANGLNRKTRFAYKPLTDTRVYTKASTFVYPLSAITPPLYVVQEAKTDNGVAGLARMVYTYQDAVFHRQGKGFLGFGKVTGTHTNTGITATTQSVFDTAYFSLAQQTAETFAGTSKTSRVVNTYDALRLGGKRVFLYAKQTETTDLLKNNTVQTTDSFTRAGNLVLEKSKYNTDLYTLEKTFSPPFDGYGNPASFTTKTVRKGQPEFSQTQAFSYTSQGKISSTTLQGLTTSYTYDMYGNRVTAASAAPGLDTRSDSSVYDASGRFPVKQFNALRQVRTDSCSDLGYLLSSKDANGLVTQNTYDSWGNLVQTILPDQKKAVITQKWVTAGDGAAPAGAVFYSETYFDGTLSEATYFDGAGHALRKITTGFEGVRYYTDTKYNAKDQVQEVSDPYPAGSVPSKKTSYTYDAYGRVKTQTLPSGVVITGTWSANTATTAYSTGETYTKTYDAVGLLSAATDPGGTITYLYNSAGNPISIQSPGSTLQMLYDAYGRQDTLIDPNAGTTSYRYNNFGELVSQTDGLGNTSSMTYDRLGRVITKTTGGAVARYAYDAPGAAGLTDSISCTGKAGIAYKYDHLGRVTMETRANDSESFSFAYAYDAKGRISKLTYPAGFAVQYTYNDNNDLTEIRDAATSNLIWKMEQVNDKGQLTLASYGNGKQVFYGYDGNDRLNHISVPGITDFQYQFNDKQQLDYRNEKYVINDNQEGFREDFTYDAVNRLDTVWVDHVPTLGMTYTTDRIHTKSDAGTYAYQSNNHRIDEITPANGYLPADDSITYTPEGKVRTITQGDKLLTFGYGTDNQRFSAAYRQKDTLRYTRYYFNNYEKEVKAGDTVSHLSYIYAGENLVAIYEQTNGHSAMHYVYTDYLGSLRCITDSAAHVEQCLGFDAWGNRRNPVTGQKDAGATAHLLFSRGFTGHEHLDEFGLINMNGRIFDPVLGVFISADNYVPDPGFTQSFNRYAYGFNNPMMFSDPSGDFPFLLVGMLMFQAGMGMRMYGEMNNNATLYTIGSYTMMGGGIMSGIGFTQMGGAAAIFGNGFMGGFNYAMNGGSFEKGFIQSAAPGIIFAGLNFALDNISWTSYRNYSDLPVHTYHRITLREWLPTFTSDMYMSAEAVGRYLFTGANTVQKLVPAGKWMDTQLYFESQNTRRMSPGRIYTTDYDRETVRSKTHIPIKRIYDADFVLNTPASPIILSTPGSAVRRNVFGSEFYSDFDINQDQYSISVVSPIVQTGQLTFYQHYLRLRGYIRYGQNPTNVPGSATNALNRPWYHKWLYGVN